MQMRFKFLFATTFISQLINGQIPSVVLTRITPDDIVNGGVVCPSLYPVEIICVGVEVTLLAWERNEDRLNIFTANDNEGDILQPEGPFTLFLDSISRENGRANMTSRFVSNISNLMSGDTIICRELANTEATMVLSYTLKESPAAVPTNFSVSTESDLVHVLVDISITWDLTFNLLHSVSSYRVVASEGSAASCPSSCDPSGPCMCTGLGIGVDTTIRISAINCGNQMGTTVVVIARPQVPSRPLECSAVPVYSSAGNLSAIDLTWTFVNNPPEFLPGVSQDVTDYSIAVGTMDPMTIPASTACPTNTCSHSNYSIQSLSVFNFPLSASVSAVNVIGRGEVCTPQTEIESDTRNQIFSLILDTTNIGNQTVACILLSAEECEFCYSVGDSCQNLTCIPATETPTLLPSLTQLTYCYRATASTNGIAIAVIQDTFNIACPLIALGTTTDDLPNHRCSSDSMGSVSIPHGLGCYDGQRRGALTNYQCDKWYALSGGSSRTCMGDGNWDGEVLECRLSGGNIALLVTSILMWVLSIFLTVIAAFSLKKELPCKLRSLFNLQILPLWLKITCVILLAIECVFLLIVLLLWIVYSGISSSKLQQTSLRFLIAAFVLALPWTIIAFIILQVASKCCSDDPAHKAGVQKVEKNNNMNISSNEAYGVANHDEGVEEIIYNYPQINSESIIEAQQNEAYATNIVTQGNEAYATSINPVM